MIVAIAANFSLLILMLELCKDWDLETYFEWFGIGIQEVIKHLAVFAQSGLVLLVFALLYIVKDRVKIVLGIENEYL